jgi:hypothetical protein
VPDSSFPFPNITSKEERAPISASYDLTYLPSEATVCTVAPDGLSDVEGANFRERPFRDVG